MATTTPNPTTTADATFGPDLFEFLAELRANNDRAWFEANRARFEAAARQPMLRFVAGFADRLHEVSRHFVADPRPSGGSMFRIHRDTRFSADKSPYKTHIAAQFRHDSGRDVHAPGFYLHLEPGGSLGGGGIWHPDGAALAKVRDRIVSHPHEWQAVLDAGIEIEGDALRRPPAGYDPRHPYVDDLKRKDFFTMTRFTDADVCSPGFPALYGAACRRAAPLVRFLVRALDLAW